MASSNIRGSANGRYCLAIFLIVFIPMAAIKTAVAAPLVKAAPLFCSDVPHSPGRFLTGCDLDASPFIEGIGVYLPHEIWPGESHTVDPLIDSHQPFPLVQVGRSGLYDNQVGENGTDESRPIVSTLKAAPSQSHDTPQGPYSSAIAEDDHWHYMDIDRDGTLLFFGETDRLDDWSALAEPDDGIPKDIGIGIGKRWRF